MPPAWCCCGQAKGPAHESSTRLPGCCCNVLKRERKERSERWWEVKWREVRACWLPPCAASLPAG